MSTTNLAKPTAKSKSTFTRRPRRAGRRQNSPVRAQTRTYISHAIWLLHDRQPRGSPARTWRGLGSLRFGCVRICFDSHFYFCALFETHLLALSVLEGVFHSNFPI